MSLSAFTEKNAPPTEEELRSILGGASVHWHQLLALVAGRLDPVTELWGFSGAKYGWGLRVRRKDRVILYMTPQRNQFLVSFALGEKAVKAVRETRLPARVLQAVEDAPRYAEGRGVRFAVKSGRQLAALATLARIKSES